MHTSERLHALDAVRAFALLLGVVLHAAMSFMPGLIELGWPIADSSPSSALEGSFYVIHIFRMTLFFAIAGFFAHLLFQRRGARGFASDRARRILTPLLVGWMVLTPLTAVAIVLGWRKLSSAGLTPPAPPEGQDGSLFSLGHLWFLYVLVLLYIVAIGARAAFDRILGSSAVGARARIDAGVAAIVRSGLAPVVLAIPVGAALCYIAPNPAGGIPTPDNSLLPNLTASIAYAAAFGFGWLLHRQMELLRAIEQQWPIHATLSLALTVALFASGASAHALRLQAPPELSPLIPFAYAIASWTWSFALLGLALRFLSKQSAARRYLADASYWMYLVHLPLVFALQVLVMHWPLHWSIKFPLVLASAFALLLISYHFLVRNTFLGEVLNGRRYPKTVQDPCDPPMPAANASRTECALAELAGAKKRFGDVIALDGVDLQVKRGELLALLGPNGAGKSTAIALLLGLRRADEGGAKLFGESPEVIDVRRRVGVMMQEAALASELRVREHIELVSSYYPAPLSVEEAMARSNITALANRPYGKLSGGQKRQVQFAMAICGRPQLLFLDEPTVGLDVEARAMMWSTIRGLLNRGSSVVLTTHYLEEAEALADRVAVIAKGKVIAHGSVEEMRNLVARKRISCASTLDVEELKQWPGVDSAHRDGERLHVSVRSAELVVRRLLAADPALRDLEIARAGLAEAFTELTREAAHS